MVYILAVSALWTSGHQDKQIRGSDKAYGSAIGQSCPGRSGLGVCLYPVEKAVEETYLLCPARVEMRVMSSLRKRGTSA